MEYRDGERRGEGGARSVNLTLDESEVYHEALYRVHRMNLAARDLSLVCASLRLRTILTQSPAMTVVPHEPFWAISLMQNLAKYVYNSKKWFEAYHFIPTNSPLRLNTDTKLVGVVFAPDPVLGGIDTPNGRVEFLQMVGITQRELDWLREDPTTQRVEQLIDMMRKDNPLLITDLKRTKEYV